MKPQLPSVERVAESIVSPRRQRIGVVGLGSIAQKAYLPILSQAERWELVGAYSPDQQKTQRICQHYRMTSFSALDALAAHCDAVFVHSSTASHFSVVSHLLKAGVDIYVDKPLAETLEQAEALVELAEQQQKILMVGFNRRFAPCYQQLKQRLDQPASLRMDKHRIDSVGPQDVRFTLLDDYLHVVDTALWLAGGDVELNDGVLHANADGQLLYAEHHFQSGNCQVTTSMHRQAGSQREWVQAVAKGNLYQVDEMRGWREDREGMTFTPAVPSWQTTLEQRGFVGAVHHFMTAIEQRKPAETSGNQALLSQRMIEKLLRKS
ncbi:Gfo/Idh/MocA family oxidoreductase [Pectobacterium parmentieri]|uniref:Gfo/Idh/MocA family protein n=1 Tax=Pectobacterium parmentieri TaxID=1905730 RepID=UPI000EB000DD|nr:Gfo/Idh/MocA family oxidoreductase [Pectobacterium parmentieri]AYH01317.1 virulence factor MviM [Pectobacterium parmentieri]AYH27587.1 virulence factor MviM [Pectobacterium parmentieri]AYH31892.1 virulence factor MviM [Pectobacterium parmentieri]MBI0519533.1 Gfo/Idh/MocA family oxidoreductase [Pectobacterium parmentieri]